MKSLDQKLAEFKANPSSRAFIIADAKDADMAFGARSPGPRSYLSANGARPAQFSPEVWSRDEFGYRNLPEFLDIIREVTHQGLIDILLMSAYVNEQLTIKEGLFRDSHITPAARANDATDVWAVRHGCYTREPAQPFRSASIDHIQCGKIECERDGEIPGANLGISTRSLLPTTSNATAKRFWPSRNFERKPSAKNSDIFSKYSTPTHPPAFLLKNWVNLLTTKSCGAWLV